MRCAFDASVLLMDFTVGRRFPDTNLDRISQAPSDAVMGTMLTLRR